MRVVLVIIYLITSTAALAQTETDIITGDLYIFPGPTCSPQYPSGEADMARLIRKIFSYPKKYPRVEGRIFVQFVVEKDGYVTSVKTIKGVHPLLDKATERVIWMLPPWIPGMQEGKEVATTMVLSVGISPSRNLSEPIYAFPYQEDDIYTVVEIMPEYPGGSGKMVEFISRNLKYPESKDASLADKVFVAFVVEKDGSISNVKIVRGTGSSFDNEVMRVVRSFPKWTPGVHEGKNVRVKLVIPVTICRRG